MSTNDVAGLGQFEPRTWAEDGVLLAVDLSMERDWSHATKRKSPWPPIALTLGLGLAVVANAAMHLNCSSAQQSVPIIAEPLSPTIFGSDDASADSVPLGYWSDAVLRLRALPRLPPETEGSDPELPDFDV